MLTTFETGKTPGPAGGTDGANVGEGEVSLHTKIPLETELVMCELMLTLQKPGRIRPHRNKNDTAIR